jgi:hypothetical protein
MAFKMACPNFKKGLKTAFSPLGVKFPTNVFVCKEMFLSSHV